MATAGLFKTDVFEMDASAIKDLIQVPVTEGVPRSI